MNNTLRMLEWDSEFFGYRVAKIVAEKVSIEKLHALVDEARSAGTRLVYLFTDPADDVSCNTANLAAAKLVDQKVTFHIKIHADDIAGSDVHVEDFKPTVPTDKLIELAIQSGLYSRYKVDSNFRNNEFEKLYIKWIENSVNKKIADHVFVYKDAEKLLGFVTLKLKENCGEIGLIAVDENSRGRSIGKKLVLAVMELLARKDIKELEVATQRDNNDACNFYSKIGFAENRSENIYHIWL